MLSGDSEGVLCQRAPEVGLRSNWLLVVGIALGAWAAAPGALGAQDAPRGRVASTAAAVATPPADVIREIERSASRVQRLLGDARRAGTAQQTRCLDATLSQITATLRLGLERTARARRYSDRGDAELATRERALIARLLVRTRELEAEARVCVDPEADLAPNRTRVTTIIDPSVPTDAIRDDRPRDRERELGALHDR